MSDVQILLVEDNPDDIELTLMALENQHVTNRIVVVNDGQEALDFLFRQGAYQTLATASIPRLILLDLKLPKLNGLEVLQRIKADPTTRTIPVVILTSSHEEPDIQKCYALGANSYIVKPVDFEQFALSIKQVGFYWLILNKPLTP